MEEGWDWEAFKIYLKTNLTSNPLRFVIKKPTHSTKPQVATVAREYVLNRELLKRLHAWRGDYWKFNSSHYKIITESEMKADVMNYLADNDYTHEFATINYRNSVMENIRSKHLLKDIEEDRVWINDLSNKDTYIILKNGILNIDGLIRGESKVLFSHSPDYLSSIELPYYYEPDAQCPLWEAHLDKILPDKRMHAILQQWFGYCLTKDTGYQRFIILTGEGSNGKSVCLSVLQNMLGRENVSSVALETFDGTHALVDTIGKLANICTDISELDKTAEGLLKAYTAGDYLQFNPKFKATFSAKPTAKLIFSTNNLPHFSDRSAGIWRRLILIPFDVEVPRKEQIPFHTYMKQLNVELPGILNWAITGLASLRNSNQFVKTEKTEAAKTEYRQEVNPARTFLIQECEYDANFFGQNRQTIFDVYRKYCSNGNTKPLNITNFSREITRIYPLSQLIREIDPVSQKRDWIFKGVKTFAGDGF